MTRDEAIKMLRPMKYKYLIQIGSIFDTALDMAIEALQTDIVRCGECNEWDEYARDKLGRCDCHLITTRFDDFCSYGERGEVNE